MVNVFKKIMLFTAFLIALVIFVAGFYTGFLLDDYRVSDVDYTIANKQLDTESFVVEKDFFDTFGIKDCNILSKKMESLGSDLVDMGNMLTRYDAKGLSHGNSYNLLRRKYFLLEIKAYVFKKQISQICPGDNSNVILFFYNTKNNQDSLNQGYVLDTLSKKYTDLTILSFDKDFNESAIGTLTDYYDVTSAPTIVLNFDKRFEGYTPESAIVKDLNK